MPKWATAKPILRAPVEIMAHVLQTFTDTLNGLDKPMRQTLTYDRGREMRWPIRRN